VAIKKTVPVRRHGAPAGATTDITLPVFSYQNDHLADLIVAAWANGPFTGGGVNVPHLGDALVDRGPPYGPSDDARPQHGQSRRQCDGEHGPEERRRDHGR
jgi:hypothetical protein